jgi:hypothetical protein
MFDNKLCVGKVIDYSSDNNLLIESFNKKNGILLTLTKLNTLNKCKTTIFEINLENLQE